MWGKSARVCDDAEKGRIVDKGTQPELLSRCPLYQKLWQAHVGAQNWAVGKEA